MKMGKHSKKRQQSGSGRAVLVTFYVVRPRRNKDGGGGASAASSRKTHHHHRHDVYHHHHHHLHHHLHGRSRDEARRGSDRRADLLEYSRQLRATSAATTTPPHPKQPLPPPRRDIKATKPVSAVRHDDHPAADGDCRLVRQRRLERAASLQEVRYRCLGYGGDWNWKKVLKLVLPCKSNSTGRQSSTRSKKRRDSVDSDSKKNSSKQAKAWPAAVQLVSKLKVNRMSRSRTSSNDDEGLVKKLFSMFRKQARPSR